MNGLLSFARVSGPASDGFTRVCAASALRGMMQPCRNGRAPIGGDGQIHNLKPRKTPAPDRANKVLTRSVKHVEAIPEVRPSRSCGGIFRGDALASEG
jgi:hypothetical protein